MESSFRFDIKSHKLDFYEVENPWDDAGALLSDLQSNGTILELMAFHLQKTEKTIFSLMKEKEMEPGMAEMVMMITLVKHLQILMTMMNGIIL